MGQQLPLVDVGLHGDLLLPQAALPHLSRAGTQSQLSVSISSYSRGGEDGGLIAKVERAAGARHLANAQPVGQDAVHAGGLHLGPLQREAVRAGPVLPQGAGRVVVELGGEGLPWRRENTRLLL